MRVLRWVLGAPRPGGAGGLRARACWRRGAGVPATPVPTYVAPPPAEDSAVTVAEAVPLDSPDDPDRASRGRAG